MRRNSSRRIRRTHGRLLPAHALESILDVRLPPRGRLTPVGYTAFDRFVARRRFRAARPHIRAGARVCDIGCGADAPFLRFLGARVSFGVGLDSHVAGARAAGGIHLIHADIRRGLPLAGNTFDHVALLAVIEHLPEPMPVLCEALRILSPGGTLVITWPSAAVDPMLWVLTRVGLVKAELGFDQHQPRFAARVWKEKLREIGFGAIDHGTFELGLNNWLVARKPE